MANNIVTNADDVSLTIKFADGPTIQRVIAQDFTITAEQTINSISGLSQNTPKGLTKGDIEYTFSFTIQGQDIEVMKNVSDDEGDAKVFDFTAAKMPNAEADGEVWTYSLTTCLADTEEITGTTGEAMEMSVEGMAAGLDKPSGE